MSNRKGPRKAASATPPARKSATPAAPKAAHGPRRVTLPSPKAAEVSGPKDATATPRRKIVVPQIEAPGPHTIAGMKPQATPAPAQEVTALPEDQAVSVPLNIISALLAVAPLKETRTNMNGIFIHQIGQELRLCATDGHRMLVITRPQLEPLNWGEAGVIIPSAELGRILKYTGKDDKTELSISFGLGHMSATLREGLASFQVRPVEGPYVQYQRVMDTIGQAFEGGERSPLEVAGVNAKYVKAAGAVSAALGSEAMFFFPPADEKSATVFTFGGFAGALLVIMPMSAAGNAIAAATVRLIGHTGMGASIAALRAHATRNRNAAHICKDPEAKKRLEALAAGYLARIDDIMASLTPALPAPQAADKAA